MHVGAPCTEGSRSCELQHKVLIQAQDEKAKHTDQNDGMCGGRGNHLVEDVGRQVLDWRGIPVVGQGLRLAGRLQQM